MCGGGGGGEREGREVISTQVVCEEGWHVGVGRKERCRCGAGQEGNRGEAATHPQILSHFHAAVRLQPSAPVAVTHLLLLKPRQPYMLLAVSLSACCLICSCCSSTGSLQAAQNSTAQQSQSFAPSLPDHSAGHSRHLSANMLYSQQQGRDTPTCNSPSVPSPAIPPLPLLSHQTLRVSIPLIETSPQNTHLQLFICAFTSRRLRTRPWITVARGASPVPLPLLPAPPAAAAAVGSAGMLPSVGRLTVVKQILYSCRGGPGQDRTGRQRFWDTSPN